MKIAGVFLSLALLSAGNQLFAQAAAPALPPEVEAAIKAQADAMKSQPAGAPRLGAPRAGGPPMPPSLASGKAGDDISLSVANISESRNSSGTGTLNLNIYFSGAGIPTGTVIRQISATKVTDDTGASVLAQGRSGAITSPISAMMSVNNRLAAAYRAAPSGVPAPVANSLSLGGTARSAKAIAVLEGQVDLFAPSEANGSMVTVKNVRSRIGKPLTEEPLVKNGIEFVMLTQEQLPEYQARTGAGVGGGLPPNMNGIPIYVRDPNNMLVGYVVLDDAGAPNSGFSSVGGGARGDGGVVVTAMFPRGAPQELQVVFFLAVPGAIKTVPFRIENIPLP